MSEVNNEPSSAKANMTKVVQLTTETGPMKAVGDDADVFVSLASGRLIPLVTIVDGGVAFPADSDIALIIVPREDSSVVPTAGTQGDAEAFGLLVAKTIGIDSAIFEKITKETIGEVLAGQATLFVQKENEREQERLQTSLQQSESILSEEIDRTIFSAETFRDPDIDLDINRLVAVLTHLGNVQGFVVTAPTQTELDVTKNPLELIAHKSSIRFRPLQLSESWDRDAVIPMLGVMKHDDGSFEPVALFKKRGKFQIQRSSDVEPELLTPQLKKQIEPVAQEFYAPLAPTGPAHIRDIMRLGLRGMGGKWVLAILMAIGVVAAGMVTPILTNEIVGSLIPRGEQSLLIEAGIALAVCSIVIFVFSLVQNFTVSAISQISTRNLQSAFWDRLLSLPVSFFRQYSSGDLAVRSMAVNSLSSILSVQVVSATLGAIFGIFYVAEMLYYNVLLGLVGAAFMMLTVFVLIWGLRALNRQTTLSLHSSITSNGWMVQMLNGLSKIRIANAENRLAAKYFELVRTGISSQARITIVTGRVQSWFLFSAAAAPALFYLSVSYMWSGAAPNISQATYLSFYSSYSLAFAAVAGLSGLLAPLATIAPTYNLLEPIMGESTETGGNLQDPGVLEGKIDFSHIAFRYNSETPLVLRDLSFSAQPGEMIALVGPSGAGKSTITRLLLAFESPESGEIFYDGKNLEDLDPTLVRRQMGVVVQSGRITRSSILKNIVGAASSDEQLAWKAAEEAAIAEEIKAMPMGMQTLIDPTNISGGQAQRILIARALVHRPKIMILDEATSALDNEAQAQITAALKNLKCTRIVIAHRLSTIKSADRIVVIDAGEVAEIGSFEELMRKDGLFASLVRRQTA